VLSGERAIATDCLRRFECPEEEGHVNEDIVLLEDDAVGDAVRFFVWQTSSVSRFFGGSVA
tara:strand:+ start:506 stop:688 length:183 start_codon:yes stop_codon:yes gene_type:complete